MPTPPTLTDAAEALRAGAVTSVRLTEDALAAADRGPLHGIPFGIKDVIAVAEGPTKAQSTVLDPRWPPDATRPSSPG
ncbi:hypothetical protein [Actinomadura sp. NTSP31]|uniref:hypothetical protein n=1 Tax=Actinomadura sp. NTSP31 TaxID=1735447 RepID=UPI0035C22408